MTEQMAENIQWDTAALQADLIDLLQLEFDALASYTVAIMGLRRPDLRETLKAFRHDHDQHARALSAKIGALGGVPLALPHIPTGLLKLGVQAVTLIGGDRAILLGFVSNEWQSREKYARYAARPYPAAVAALLERHAADEARHYEWACSALEKLDCGTNTIVGRTAEAFARFHGNSADAVEALGRGALEATIRAVSHSKNSAGNQ
jgi:rubrerythrin